MRRQVQQLSVDFIARGQSAVSNATRSVVNSMKSLSDANRAQAASTLTVAQAEAQRKRALEDSKSALEATRKAAEDNVRAAEENARREIAATQKAAASKTEAARKELADRRKALSEAQANRAVQRSSDPFNAVREGFQQEIAQHNALLKKLREAQNESKARLEIAPPSERAEIKENVDYFTQRIEDTELRKRSANARFRAGNKDALARRKAENEVVERAREAVEDQKKVVEATKEGERDAVAAVEQAEKDKIAAAKQTAAETVKAAKAAHDDVVKSSKSATAHQINDLKAVENAAKGTAGKLRTLQSNLPKLGLDTLGKGAFEGVKKGWSGLKGGWGQLSDKGVIPTVAPMLFKGAWQGLKLVPGAIGLATSLAGKLLSTVWDIGAGVVRMGANFVMWIGQKAVSAVGLLISGLGSALGLLVRLGTRAAFVGIGLGTGAALFAKKAIGDSAKASTDLNDETIGSGTNALGLQGMKALASRDAIDPSEIVKNLKVVQGAMHQAFTEPGSEADQIFQRLGIRVEEGFTGRLKDAKNIFFEIAKVAREQRWSMPDFERELTPLLGSYENWAKLMPMFQRMMSSNGFDEYEKALQRKANLGGLIDGRDVAIGKAYKVVVSDVEDAWLGVKLAISRAIGPEVLRITSELTTIFAGQRFTIADYAVKGLNKAKDIASDLMRILMRRPDLVQSNVMREIGYAAEWVRYAVVRAWQGIKQLREDMSKPVNAAWLGTLQTGLFATGRLIREMILTAGGDVGMVKEFPWLISLRDGVFKTVRFVREAFNTLAGNIGLSNEFPWLKALKSGVDTAIGTVRAFGRELWTAISGGDTPATARFPWIFVARDSIGAFVQNVKLQWSDLMSVWSGGQAQTALGGFLDYLGQKLNEGVTVFWSFIDNVKKLWGDLDNVLSGGPGSTGRAFEFPGLDAAYQKLKGVYEGVQAVWDKAKGIYGFIDGIVSRMTFGTLNLPTIGLLTMLGVTRLVAGALRLAIGGIGGMRGALGKLGGMIGAGAAAGATGAVGAGVAAGMTALAAGTISAGDAAEKSTGKWSRLHGAIGKIGGLFARNPWLGSLLGIGASVAGGFISDAAEPNTVLGGVMSVGGGALSGAGMGAMLGSLVPGIGTGIGALAGGAYGALSGYWEYLKKSRDQKISEFKAANPTATDDQAASGVAAMDNAAMEVVNAASETKEAADDLKGAAAALESAPGAGSIRDAFDKMRRDLASDPSGFGAGLNGIRIPDRSPIASAISDAMPSTSSAGAAWAAQFPEAHKRSMEYFDPAGAAKMAADRPLAAEQPGARVEFYLPGGETVRARIDPADLADARRDAQHYQGRRF